MSERRASSEGRRGADQWLGRIVKIIAVLTASAVSIGAVSQGLNAIELTKSNHAAITAVGARVTALETSSGAVSYMTCVMFAETHKATEVPIYCDKATRARR